MSPADILILAGIIIFAIGELVAFFDGHPGNTASERIRAWVTLRPWRVAFLMATLALLATHLVFAWPW